MKVLWSSILFAGTMASAFGQFESRRANIRGTRGDSGKCTIEVTVDGVAEIEISGDRANMRTLQGTPSNFIRFECTDALPRYPDSFRFSGVDGRGRQSLIRDPRENRGTAVVRIEDPKGGREGYTFDIEWRGYANSPTNGVNNDRGRYDPGRYDNRTRAGTQAAIDGCIEAVRAKADRERGYRNLNFGRVAFDDNPGRRDYVVGRFTFRRGGTQDEFDFTCSVDLTNGRVRNVEIRRW